MIGEISNTQDLIDSRDIIARIEELENEIEDLTEEDDEYQELKEELGILKDVEEQANYGDWSYGETLIHEDYFVEYCEELLIDIGYLPRDLPGFIAIDMEATAENMKMDYTEIDFDGETYYMRG